MYEITIPGTPIVKTRPRFARRGEHVVAYSNQETEEGRAMNFIRAAFNHTPLDGALTLEAEFHFAPPASASKKRQTAMLSGQEPCLNSKDTDNLLKFVMDASNGILWHDDRQVVCLSGFKIYGPQNKTVIRVGHTVFFPLLPEVHLTVPGFGTLPQMDQAV